MRKIILLFSILIISSITYAKNMIITSIQPLYSICCYLTKGTDIKVYNSFDSDVSMTMTKEKLSDSQLKLKEAKQAQAVVDIRKVWGDDIIFRKARNENIKIIEIDASDGFGEKDINLYLLNNKGGNINPFIWLDSKNLLKMANIIERDLARIYPKNAKKLEKNLLMFSKEVFELKKDIEEKLQENDIGNIIVLTENLQYLINDLGIYSEYVDPKEIKEDNLDKIFENSGSKVIVSDRWLKKAVIKEIEKRGGKFVFIETLDVPIDKDGQMEPEAILSVYKDNYDKVSSILKR